MLSGMKLTISKVQISYYGWYKVMSSIRLIFLFD